MDDISLQSYIGRKIRALRAMRGMTQKSLEAATGIPQRFLSRYEGGKWRAINPNHLAAIAEALDTSVDCIMGRT